jgi:thiamine-monophosphate kinase
MDENERTIEQTGEFGVIARLRQRLPQGAGVLLGPGDDAALVAASDRRVVATTDLLLEGIHFRRDWSSAYDIGRKAAAQNLADIAAMGARPTALLVALVAPGSLPVSWTDHLAAGLADEAAVVGASIVGGDTVRGDTITVAVTALGDLRGRKPVTRDGARPGDVIAVAGWLGWSAAGFALLSAGHVSPRALVEAHRRPEPPYDAGPAASDMGATAMIDVSDGLLADVGHIAEASRLRADIESARLDVPAQLREAARKVSVADPLTWVLGGGEDHALVATFPAGTRLPSRWRVIGAMSSGRGVTVDGATWSGPSGWRHFA